MGVFGSTSDTRAPVINVPSELGAPLLALGCDTLTWQKHASLCDCVQKAHPRVATPLPYTFAVALHAALRCEPDGQRASGL